MRTRVGIYSFELDFFEQGIERRLLFEDDMDFIKITCSSRTDWLPKPSSIVMTKAEISNMFEALYQTFVELGSVICEGLVNHFLLKDWKM
ncbi:hypothetical protein J2Z70_005125 [Paenibacillus silagei]|uniref:Uncharacterized protein n=2 Tax=Paenibacillus silagei TaxID=1670801 RepID=A0ABS4NY20_9BACL|nr:hypothetical protein [Paenibacillus silagei]